MTASFPQPPSNGASHGAPISDSDSPAGQLQSKMQQLELAAKEREIETKARAIKIPYINLKGFPISPESLKLIPEDQANQLKVVCFFNSGTELRLGAIDPTNQEVQELLYQLEERKKSHGVLYCISEESFLQAMKLYATLPKIKEIVKGVEVSTEEIAQYEKELKSFRDLQEKINKVPVTDVMTLIMAAGLQARTSDVHVEAEEADVKVRFRVDGVLVDVAKLEKSIWPRIASRIKLISGLKINITNRPQDGRLTIFYKEEKVDVRVSTIPTAYGESVVMRILRQAAVALEFNDLGFRGSAFEKLKREIERPNGMIITTGPTGSGKTTTLYAILKKLNTPETKIITLEDPIEYKLQGINQSQIETSKDYTFAKGLRSILRQDPDVVMVGEMRDLETADVAINAALTGHLVLSTIHTNSAAGAIPRFLAMGTKPFLLSPALNAVIGQRLVRRVCEKCKTEDQLDPETLERVKKTLADLPEAEAKTIDLNNMKFYKGAGCEACNSLGYKGRLGIYEIFTMNAEIEKVIKSDSVSEYEMEAIAKKNGMVTMVQDGLLKALDGLTSIEEVFAVAE